MPAPSRPSSNVSQIPSETAILAPEENSRAGNASAGNPNAETASRQNVVDAPGFRSNAFLIYETMRQRIAIRHYQPGAWLKEQEIAAEFGVSRTPVRQALQQLETEGLVEIKNGVGVRVTEVDDAALDQIYLLRLELVALIGRAAPQALSPADMDAIRAVGEDLKRMIAAPAAPDIGAFSTHCEVFHNLVNKVIGSPMLKHFIEVLYHQADRYWYGWMESTDPRREVEFLYNEVQETLRALEVNDFEAVGFVRRNHISMMLARMAEFRAKSRRG
jgi:DNA-binding GntR family transcriptional regulator